MVAVSAEASPALGVVAILILLATLAAVATRGSRRRRNDEPADDVEPERNVRRRPVGDVEEGLVSAEGDDTGASDPSGAEDDEEWDRAALILPGDKEEGTEHYISKNVHRENSGSIVSSLNNFLSPFTPKQPTLEDLFYTPPPSLETVYQGVQHLSDHDRRLYLNRLHYISLPVMALVLEYATGKCLRKCTTLAHSSTALGQYNTPQDSVAGFVGGASADITAAAIAKATADNKAIRYVYAIILVLPGDFAALRAWYNAKVDPDAAAIQRRLQALCIELGQKAMAAANPNATKGPFLVFLANASKTGPEGVAIMKYKRMRKDMEKAVAKNGLGASFDGTTIWAALQAIGTNGCLWKNVVWIVPVSEEAYKKSSAGTLKHPSQAFLDLVREGGIA